MYVSYTFLNSAGFIIKRGSPPEGEPLLEAGGGLLEMGYFRLKLGLRGGARHGPQQEPGPLLAQPLYTPRYKGAIFMKMGEMSGQKCSNKKEGNNQDAPSTYEVVLTVGIITHGSGRHGGTRLNVRS